MKRIRAIFAIFVGLSVISLWIMLISTGQVPEFSTAPVEILLHIAAEGIMSVVLLIAGIMLLKNRQQAMKVFLIGDGMLLYSVINSSGYYLQRGEPAMPIMFLVLMLIGTGLAFDPTAS